jgi:hypothetical protein
VAHEKAWAEDGNARVANEKAWAEDGNARVANEKSWAAGGASRVASEKKWAPGGASRVAWAADGNARVWSKETKQGHTKRTKEQEFQQLQEAAAGASTTPKLPDAYQMQCIPQMVGGKLRPGCGHKEAPTFLLSDKDNKTWGCVRLQCRRGGGSCLALSLVLEEDDTTKPVKGQKNVEGVAEPPLVGGQPLTYFSYSGAADLKKRRLLESKSKKQRLENATADAGGASADDEDPEHLALAALAEVKPKVGGRRGPKRPLQRDHDGLYRRPAGRQPVGKWWHARRGKWVDDGRSGDTDDEGA